MFSTNCAEKDYVFITLRNEKYVTDWTLCFICQDDDLKETLECPDKQ